MKKPAYVEGYDLTLKYCQWAAIADMLEKEYEEISQYIWDEIAIYTQQIKKNRLQGSPSTEYHLMTLQPYTRN